MAEVVDVLVVGAGPTGLAMAADLARRGVKVKIADKITERSPLSRALGVQAGTLEALEDAFGNGTASDMIARGCPAREAFIHIDGLEAVRVDLTVIDGAFNFILILEQSETEKILEQILKKYGVAVDYGMEIVKLSSTDGEKDASQADAGITRSVFRDQSGKETEILARYVVGCDGAHSAVRRQMNFDFMGAPYSADFVLGDVQLEWPYEFGSVRSFIGPLGGMVCFPMKGDRKYRIVFVPKARSSSESPDVSPKVSKEDFARQVDAFSRGEIKITDSFWLTRFRVHHRMAKNYRQGRVFLAGDAAHIHSPAGGQGMNTGIQDALNLSSKLSLVLKGHDPRLLEKYEAERLPVAKQVVRGTDLPIKGAQLKENVLTAIARKRIFRRLVATKWIQRRVVTAISEVKVARRDIEIRKAEALLIRR